MHSIYKFMGGKEINENVALSLNIYICLPLIHIQRIHMKRVLFCCNIAHEENKSLLYRVYDQVHLIRAFFEFPELST
jgi:hypothetical protein